MTLNIYTEEKRLLELQFQTEKYELLINHQVELLESEKNDVSELSKSKMLLRQASENVCLTQKYLSLCITLYKKYKSGMAEMNSV